MGGCVITTGNRHIVHKMPIDRRKLEEIANILGISQAERNEILSSGESIQIYAGARPTSGAPPTSGASPTSGAPPTPPGGDRR